MKTEECTDVLLAHDDVADILNGHDIPLYEARIDITKEQCGLAGLKVLLSTTSPMMANSLLLFFTGEGWSKEPKDARLFDSSIEAREALKLVGVNGGPLWFEFLQVEDIDRFRASKSMG